jgi:plastocyanin
VKSGAAALAAVAVLLLAMPSGAALPVAEVAVQFSAYGPSTLDVLPGQTVKWTNVSIRTHTVTSDDGLFSSGDVESGARFEFTFSKAGIYRYHCTIHPGITGEVDVRPVILDGLPTAAVPVGTPVEFDGRVAAVGRRVLIQQRVSGSSFTTVAEAKPKRNGSWTAMVAARTTGDFRAVSGRDASETRRMLVSDRHVVVHATRGGLAVTVTPAAPYAPYLVEVYLRERFGWWPVSRGELDYISEADVHVRRPARVRVVLVDKDGWTPLATSRAVRLARR